MTTQKNFNVFLFILLLGVFSPLMAQTMSDSQVLEYVKEGIKQGKEQKQLASELARKGVTKEQAMRVKQLYEQQNNVNASNAAGTDVNESRLREEMDENTSDILEDRPGTEDLARSNQVFGRNIFNTRNLTFEPSVNIATPLNYRLGPGDEVIIDIWGASQNTIRQQISPDGTINIQKIGPVNLSGMTIAEANDYLKRTLNKIYNGLNNTNDPTSDIRLTLGGIRTIQINVMGEVVQPGTYSLSSFSTVFHALYRAGGVSDIGSLRNVQLVRNGKNIATIDVYQFIMKGNIQDDIRLQEGDVVIVPAYEVLVKIDGKVKRPMRFEMKKDENLSTLISYAGGFDADAYTRSLRVVRQNGQEYEVNTVKDLDYSVYKMRNGDVVTAEAILNRFTNKLEIRGAVYRPGIYQLNGRLNTVRELVNEAQGLTGDAFLNRAVLYRQREDLTTEVVPVDIKAIMDGTSQNIILTKNDILYIPSIHDLEDRGDVVIHGEVAKPDSYSYADNMTLEDLIIQAGGLREAASVVRVDVSRRIRNPYSTVDNDTIGRTYTFSLKEGFVVDGTPGFVLQPYDEVYVRRSPGYQAQQNVSVEGEILFEGSYAMTSRTERLSDLIRKAGGSTKNAYLRGAKLTRVATEGEKKRMEDVLRLMSRQLGEAMMDSLDIHVEDHFTVGIDLEKALANPGSTADIVLREGDVVFIPKSTNTVKINGAVMVPNTVSYISGKHIDYYLNQAGGYADNAKKSKKFIVYMNGQVTKVKGSGKKQIEPGCEIIVPSRSKKRTNMGEILGYATSFSSLGMMIASLANLIKK
ncbi:SLBB domain-containing protein [Bacteroides caecimuris]|uniref:Capsule biosynthesis protein n=1 Tax=Bacteroides caecimuris TaxID=1796613 RepID=A0A1C7H2J9_9BACE|nr:SLBB domain-containing protein [Bacteroides caecimuris]ANU58022.1 capsule biosynthesis protein [Bacteroides caecimuris]OXE68085.1 capsule biosynthesis protein [Bacteroides caecimuris]QQR17095.1 SLBB domain-containing protein [Bacteroides caecimuris]UQA30073.1 SLBB domain-containing protein [Bacteroides caecimuris]